MKSLLVRFRGSSVCLASLASRVRRPVASVVVLSLFSVLFFSTAAFAENCESCRKKHREACGHNCENQNSKSGYESCANTCLEKVCSKACPFEGLTGGSRSPTRGGPGQTPCEKCVARAETASCNTECEYGSPRFMSCRKKCAKLKCSSECDLPAVDGSDREEATDKFACDNCLEQAKKRCAQNPACAVGPGSITCRTACAFKQCSRECRQD